MSDPKSSSNGIASAIVLLVVVVGAIAVFYFGVYDTAAGRCSRGDFGACAVVPIRLYVPNAAVSTSVETPQSIDTPTPAPTEECVLGVTTDHVTVKVVGPDALGCAELEGLVPHPNAGTWLFPGIIDLGASINCEGAMPHDGAYTVVVYDDPGGAFAVSICRALGFTERY